LSLKKEIKSKGFHSEQEKLSVNLILTAAYFESKFTQFIKDYGISAQQYNVLRILRGQVPDTITSGDLQSRTLHKMSNATRLVDKLIEKGFAARVKNVKDKRIVLISITDSGLKLLTQLDDQVYKFNQNYIKLPEAQLMVLNFLLDQLRGASKE
tara:strand:+ start:1706 stop:2167 length:462 start_codon:yes stop_codon:yes gene_type:complete